MTFNRYGKMRARRNSQCIRCCKTIYKGSWMERWEDGPTYQGTKRWVHVGCKQEEQFRPEMDATPTTTTREVIREELASLMETRLSEALTQVKQETRASVRGQVEKFFDEMKPERLEVEGIDGIWREVGETVHPQFRKVWDLAKMRKHVMLIGPAGSGKSYLAKQIADELGLPFDMTSFSGGTSEGHLLGRLLPTGESGRFEPTSAPFVRMFRDGGVFLGDEMDAADSNVLTCLNESLSNGRLVLMNHPDAPTIERHPDFIFIGAANTYGKGGDRMYCGRNALDEATLDRFRVGQVEMDYSKELDAHVCPDRPLRTRLQQYRDNVTHNRLERIVSTRFLKDAWEMKTGADWTDEQIDAQLFMGWREDEVALAKGTTH